MRMRVRMMVATAPPRTPPPTHPGCCGACPSPLPLPRAQILFNALHIHVRAHSYMHVRACMQIEATRAYAIAQASLGLMREGPARAEGHLASLDRMSRSRGSKGGKRAGSGGSSSGGGGGAGWRGGEALAKEERAGGGGGRDMAPQGSAEAAAWTGPELRALGLEGDGQNSSSQALAALAALGDGFGSSMEGDVGLSAQALQRRRLTLETAQQGQATPAALTGAATVAAKVAAGDATAAGLGKAGFGPAGRAAAGGVEQQGSKEGSGGEGGGEVNGAGKGGADEGVDGAGNEVLVLSQPCGVCFEEPNLGDQAAPPVVMVSLQPCGHVLCAQCALQVRAFLFCVVARAHACVHLHA